jgi:hypothetical protein
MNQKIIPGSLERSFVMGTGRPLRMYESLVAAAAIGVSRAKWCRQNEQGATRANQVHMRAEGESAAFLVRQLAHAEHPDLSAFRLLWRTLGTALAGRSKLLLDPRIKGRRHVWMADPTALGAGKIESLRPTPRASPGRESDD